MMISRAFAAAAVLVAPATLVAAPVDIPGGPGTGARVAIDAPGVASDLASAVDSDWFRAPLRAGKLYAFTYHTRSFVGRDGVRLRFTARDAGGRLLAVADQQAGGDFDLTTQFNFRPQTAGTYFFELKLAPRQAEEPAFPVEYQVGLAGDVSSGFDDAAGLPFGTEVAGTMQSNDDVDYHVVWLQKGQPVDLVSPIGVNDVVRLYDRDRGVVGEVDSDFGKLAHYVPTYTGRHFVSVDLFVESDYTLKVAPADRGRPTPGRDLLIGTNGPDRIDALGGDDLVRGLAGADTLSGGPGSDAVFGGAGNDRVKSGEGQDDLFGEDGDDVLTGGLGPDRMTGGLGRNRYLYFGDADRGYDSGSRANPFPLEQGLDQIEDFATGDRIDLRGVDADATTPGRQAFAFVGTARFSGPGQVRHGFEPFGSNAETATLIALNTDADAAPEVEIALRGRRAMRAADFLLREPSRRLGNVVAGRLRASRPVVQAR